MITLDSKFLTYNLQELMQQYQGDLLNCKEELLKRQSDPNDWLGWLNLHKHTDLFQDIQSYADRIIQSNKFDNLVILGIGGSALGPQALMSALYPSQWNELDSQQRSGGLKTYFIDNVDPDYTADICEHIDIKRTLFCTITKSGSTAETIGSLLYILEKLQIQIPDSWEEHLVLITDPEKGALRAFGNNHPNIQSFPIFSNVGGRFSVFSPVGMLPLALMGTPILKFQEALSTAYQNYLCVDNVDNIFFQLAVILHHAYIQDGKIMNVLMPYSSHLSKISDWYVQLVAESLGKNRKTGPTPIKAVGATDQHSQVQLFAEGPLDKLLFFIQVDQFDKEVQIPSTPVQGFERLSGVTFSKLIQAERLATSTALYEHGVPNATIHLTTITEQTLGHLLYGFELMTAISGYLFKIDPFNQPGVELGKKYTYTNLGV